MFQTAFTPLQDSTPVLPPGQPQPLQDEPVIDPVSLHMFTAACPVGPMFISEQACRASPSLDGLTSNVVTAAHASLHIITISHASTTTSLEDPISTAFRIDTLKAYLLHFPF